MDIASLIGFIGAIGMILGAMISGGGVAPFIDVPSILIVVGGTFFSVSAWCMCLFHKRTFTRFSTPFYSTHFYSVFHALLPHAFLIGFPRISTRFRHGDGSVPVLTRR